MKVSQADIAFSWCVRERAEWTCEICGTVYHPPTAGLQCSHFIGRGHYATRYHPLNAFAHCAGCHFKMESNPHNFVKWVKKTLGEKTYNSVVRLSENITEGKAARQSEKQISKHYRSELARMQELRAQGVTGRIEFTDWRT